MTEQAKTPSDMERMRDLEEERLRQRLLAVERETEQLRSRARFLGIGLVIALVLGGLGVLSPILSGFGGGTAELDELRAEHVVLIDPGGNARGEWAVDEDGNARLAILDHQARPRLSLSVLNGGFPGLSLINASGERRAALGLLPDESVNLVLSDAAGTGRAVLGLTRTDDAHLVFADAESVPRVALGLEGSGQGIVALPDVSQPEDSIGGGR